MNDKFDKTKKPYKKRNIKNKKNRPVSKDKFRDDFDDAKEIGTNDPAWYAKYPELMRASASIPYSIPTGGRISWNLHVDSSKPVPTASGARDTSYESIPGVMTLGIVPTPGLSIDATSAVNVAADLLYTNVRAENSGSRNYDSPDLMLYCLAMDQVYSLITWYNRIYGCMMLYSQFNRYLPKALLAAQHVDFGDMIQHINDFKAFMDTATAQAAAFSVPGDIDLFKRHAFMYQNVYKDADSIKSQLYMFAPRCFYQFDEMSGPGQLKMLDIVTTYPNMMKFVDLIDLFHKLMDPIISSEDFNIMSGDILKAYKANNLIKLQLMPVGYTITPITDYEVLTQIKNATLTRFSASMILGFGTDTSWDIQQDSNADYLVWDPFILQNTTAQHNYTSDLLLSTYKADPQPEDNMVYTRLMYTLDEIAKSGGQYDMKFATVGTEFVVGCTTIFYFNHGTVGWTLGSENLELMSMANLSGTNMDTLLNKFMMAKHFDFCPALYIFYSGTGDTKTWFFPFFDVDNWTIIHSYELSKMHNTAVMSMLRVPMIGSALPNTKI